MRLLDDGIEFSAEPGRSRGRVLIHSAGRPENDEVLNFLCEIDDVGASATTMVGTLDGDRLNIWAAELAESYAGWDGIRSWKSLDHNLRIDATHDGRGHVSLRFVLRGPRGYEPDAWEASTYVEIDAGEDTRRLAAEITAFLA
ncbi:DUF6228 family protein [Cryptosporangium sp. NPDC051539]|uniref:DUF6228 family protein n=1 Tax=Cryptosporangium sp. NPDC051539 TaxID=3363962 RepID=UPI0037ABF9EE